MLVDIVTRSLAPLDWAGRGDHVTCLRAVRRDDAKSGQVPKRSTVSCTSMLFRGFRALEKAMGALIFRGLTNEKSANKPTGIHSCESCLSGRYIFRTGRSPQF